MLKFSGYPYPIRGRRCIGGLIPSRWRHRAGGRREEPDASRATTQGTSQALPPLFYGPRGLRALLIEGVLAARWPNAGAPNRRGPEGRNDARTGIAAGLPAAARCVQRFDGSLNSAIHTTYRISLRSSSMPEPRDPLPKVFTRLMVSVQRERRALFGAFWFGCRRRARTLRLAALVLARRGNVDRY